MTLNRLMRVWILFAVYGLYNGLTEGVEKALVACIAAGLFWLMANPMLIILLAALMGMLLNSRQQATLRAEHETRMPATTRAIFTESLIWGN